MMSPPAVSRSTISAHNYGTGVQGGLPWISWNFVGRRRALETQDLVAAAARVFERRGYADATLDDIAAEAGVSKPTVYQYVSSKQRLLETIVEQAIYPLREGIEQIVDSTAGAGDKLEAYVRLHVTSAARYRPTTWYSWPTSTSSHPRDCATTSPGPGR
jgi:AcrR family transcriptional regulator